MQDRQQADLELIDVLSELSAREPIFHHLQPGFMRSELETMVVSDFWEVGASGQVYSKDFIFDELERRYASGAYKEEVWEATNFGCRKLAQDVYLLTYILLQNKERKTQRVTIWQRFDTDWKIVYHQGTVIN